MKKALKIKATKLRLNGYSFKEISLLLDISKSTASVWTRNCQLDYRAIKRLKFIETLGRQKGWRVNQRKNNFNWRRIAKSCPKFKIENYSIDECKLFLALLYWGEGEKTGNRLSFSNSDPYMVNLYLELLRKSYQIDNGKFKIWLHLHEYHDKYYMLEFWSKITTIPKNQFFIYNKPHTGISKKPNYKGCLSIRYKDSNIQKEIFIIIKRMRRFC